MPYPSMSHLSSPSPTFSTAPSTPHLSVLNILSDSDSSVSAVWNPAPATQYHWFFRLVFHKTQHWNTVWIDQLHLANRTVLPDVIGQFEIQYCIFGQPTWNLQYSDTCVFTLTSWKLPRCRCSLKELAFRYCSVPLICPHFVHYIQPKVEGGLIFPLPPPPPQSFTRALRTLPKFMFT